MLLGFLTNQKPNNQQKDPYSYAGDKYAYSYKVSLISIANQLSQISGIFTLDRTGQLEQHNIVFCNIQDDYTELLHLAKYDNISYEKHSCLIYNNYYNKRFILLNTVYTLIKLVSNEIFTNEDVFLFIKRASISLKITNAELLDIIRNIFIPQSDNPYEIFQVRRLARRSTIKKKYITIMKYCHPDIIANIHIDLQGIAKERFSVYNTAFNQI